MADPAGGPPPDWAERAREFARSEVEPRAADIDRTDRIPEELVRSLARAGFLGLGLPPEFGGVDLDTPTLARVLEELSAASAAVAVTVAVHLSVCATPIATWGTPSQRAEWLPSLARGERIGAFALTEPGAGSDTASLRTRYEPQDGGYLVRGSKTFISNAASAGLLLVFATRDPGLGSHGIAAFVVPGGAAGLQVSQRFEKLGLRGSETAELVLDDLRLPTSALLGKEGEGLRIALGALTGGRVGIASCALGVARAGFEQLRATVAAADADWKRPLLARAYAQLQAASALVEKAARAKDSGASYTLEASVAKLAASKAAVEIAGLGVDVAGDSDPHLVDRASRIWRDARVFPIVEGTTEIQELILARALLEPPGAPKAF